MGSPGWVRARVSGSRQGVAGSSSSASVAAATALCLRRLLLCTVITGTTPAVVARTVYSTPSPPPSLSRMNLGRIGSGPCRYRRSPSTPPPPAVVAALALLSGWSRVWGLWVWGFWVAEAAKEKSREGSGLGSGEPGMRPPLLLL